MSYKITVINKATGEKDTYEHVDGVKVRNPNEDWSVTMRLYLANGINGSITFEPEELRNIEILEEGKDKGGKAYSVTYSLREYKIHHDMLERERAYAREIKERWESLNDKLDREEREHQKEIKRELERGWTFKD